jgi:hypothetical protein
LRRDHLLQKAVLLAEPSRGIDQLIGIVSVFNAD